MTRWITTGVRTGIKTTSFPGSRDASAESAPAALVSDLAALSPQEVLEAARICPTSAIEAEGTQADGSVAFDMGQCVMCGRCVRRFPSAFRFVSDPRVAVRSRGQLRARAVWHDGGSPVPDGVAEAAGELRQRAATVFGRSLHIRHVDAGSCNGCESELQLLGSPSYDLHRLGLFFTPTPRHADCLLVTGVVTAHMEQALLETWEQMPEPKFIVAAGVCAIGGGIFEGGPYTRGPLDQILPVDVYVPGSPPTPLALLHGLLLGVGRAEERYAAIEVGTDGA